MNVSERFNSAGQDGYSALRPRSFPWQTFGMTRLALRVAVLKVLGLTILLFVTLNQADISGKIAGAVLDGLLVETDSVMGTIERSLDSLAPVLTGFTPRDADGTPQPSAATPDLDGFLAGTMQGAPSRAQLFGINGMLLADSARVERASDDPRAANLAAIQEPPSDFATQWRDFFAGTATRNASPSSQAPLREVLAALGGVKTVRYGERGDGDAVVAVAAPILADDGRVIGALRLVSAPGQIVGPVREQEAAIIQGFIVAALLAVLMALVLAATISRPLVRLARAAERIKRGSVNTPIPALNASGEIGDLSRVLHEMTVALYTRIDAIDAFAAEVAHELKNPLTSLRGAVEVLPRARTEASRERLLEVIAHDVNRLDRLISDISAASKLDSELNRYRFELVDLHQLLRTIVDTQNELAAAQDMTVKLNWVSKTADVFINGNDIRLGQVFTNLIENARSFSPEGGIVIVTARNFSDFAEIMVEDEGPGIEEAAIERIFERFYTDRPADKGFGNNSGLGLAICRQIVEAHGGEIFAENRYQTTLSPSRVTEGARFTVRLPIVS
ncbi:cell wall metabolism sensor histidine kinase WalK [Acuticoccus sp. I52.16.1]|uniref:sensor histidine kinase n=1 Tax=Acuticoccus sp. I52.16.1 TaxID=2928472 RepID=UPI001FD0E56A|nr:HAMP domain-containing sensor histidine kinase [Acuticoccus sp. I52.16.1]UOM32889.1 HAMP domain-containing histidine kinase [Acuticoccus sp. I52.16.1]